MRFEIRTLTRVISTLAVLFVLVFGASLDVAAQRRGRDWGRSHNRGRHLGWERGRRVGHHRRDNDRRRRHRTVRRDRRDDHRDRRSVRRTSWNNDRNWQRSRSGRQRTDLGTRRSTQYRSRY